MAKLLKLTERDAIAPVDAAGPEVLHVNGDADPTDVAGRLAGVKTLMIAFPAFNDGRGFTLATQIRVHHGFQGEIRAIGHFIPDQAAFLVRCGFDTALFETDTAYETAEKALTHFSVVMQSAPACPRPSVLALRHGQADQEIRA